ncbi:MAG: ureidoglycolate lyase [Pseudomonadota bacterium]|nr:ureidoglycolate lyase [Pseudomonadota bacterium]
MTEIVAQPLTPEDFAPFGDVIERGADPISINAGMCERHHDLARLDIRGGATGISLFDAKPRALPYEFNLVERHPLGSQAFLPMTMAPFLVIVAEDKDGTPEAPKAFLTQPGQGVNFYRNTWHGVLTPLESPDGTPGLFAVVDRIGDGANLEEYRFLESFKVVQF